MYNDNHDESASDIDIEGIEEPGDFTEDILNGIRRRLDVDDDSNRDLLSPAELRLARDKIDSLILYLDHYREYKKNKADYYNAIKNVRENQCILSADFKQKIPIGHKLAEQSWVFRKLKLRNCLGIILQFKGKN